jgi:hypothetical protein
LGRETAALFKLGIQDIYLFRICSQGEARGEIPTKADREVDIDKLENMIGSQAKASG